VRVHVCVHYFYGMCVVGIVFCENVLVSENVWGKCVGQMCELWVVYTLVAPEVMHFQAHSLPVFSLHLFILPYKHILQLLVNLLSHASFNPSCFHPLNTCTYTNINTAYTHVHTCHSSICLITPLPCTYRHKAYIYAHTHKHTHIIKHTHTHTHIFKHTHTHTHTHTHILTGLLAKRASAACSWAGSCAACSDGARCCECPQGWGNLSGRHLEKCVCVHLT